MLTIPPHIILCNPHDPYSGSFPPVPLWYPHRLPPQPLKSGVYTAQLCRAGLSCRAGLYPLCNPRGCSSGGGLTSLWGYAGVGIVERGGWGLRYAGANRSTLQPSGGSAGGWGLQRRGAHNSKPRDHADPGVLSSLWGCNEGLAGGWGFGV